MFIGVVREPVHETRVDGAGDVQEVIRSGELERLFLLRGPRR